MHTPNNDCKLDPYNMSDSCVENLVLEDKVRLLHYWKRRKRAFAFKYNISNLN